MSRYYLIPDKQEVCLGATIEINGIRTILTEEFISMNPQKFEIVEEKKYVRCIADTDSSRILNRIYEVACEKEPELFPEVVFGIKNWFAWIDNLNDNQKVSINYETKDRYFVPATEEEYQKQCLLDKVKAEYPKGTAVNSFFSIVDSGWEFDESTENMIICYSPTKSKIILYHNGYWAEKLDVVFKSTDGVNMYEHQPYYVVNEHNTIIKNYVDLRHFQDYTLCFSSYDAAKQYVDEHPILDLEFFENQLLKSNQIAMYNAPVVKSRGFNKLDEEKTVHVKTSTYYAIMKKTDPKLYYKKVLQSIADHFNAEKVIDWTNTRQKKYAVVYYTKESRFGIGVYMTTDSLSVYFLNENDAEKAIEIMGAKMLELL